MSELVRVKFEGGIADSGQLHFYEYSRSQYARARFLATIEHFRRTEIVAERITLASNVEILVKSPQAGSFIEDVVVPALQEGMAAAISTPLSALISYVWHMMINRPEKTDTALAELASVRRAEIAASVVNEQERTSQLEILAAIANGNRATADEALSLLRYALETNNVAVGRLAYGQAELHRMSSGIEAEAQREREFADHREELETIPEDTVNRLTSRLRPMVPEMALPLRRSAETMTMSHGERGTTYASLDRATVQDIEGRVTEDELTTIEVQVRSYDRIAGVGKVTSPSLERTLNFIVPLRERTRLRDDILDAMREDVVYMTCRRVLDKSGRPTSLILIGITTEDPDDLAILADLDFL